MIGEDTTSYDYGSYSSDQAFLGAVAGNTLGDEPLRPFSFSRKIAAQCMGCQAPMLSGAAREAMSNTGLYPGALNDTIIVLWLCTLKDASEITLEDFKSGAFSPERAINQPAEAAEKARTWAELKGLGDVASEAFVEAWKKFLSIMFGIDASIFEVQVENDRMPSQEEPPPKAKPANPRRRTSSRASRK